MTTVPRNPMNGWRWRCLYVAVSVVEGIAIADMAKRSVVPIVAVCLVLCAVRLGLEALQP
ncbi:MAG TPA: hypothetical protein VFR48_03295 [Solirubrobacteraceae bacterium]|nr:hypothetical protein [Solirubrobacteraceae bacterium]